MRKPVRRMAGAVVAAVTISICGVLPMPAYAINGDARNNRGWRSRCGAPAVGIFMTLGLLISGCASGAGPVGPVIAGTASLDRTSAQITLPLDRFGQSPYEFRLVQAARLIDMKQCLEKQGYDTPSYLENARAQIRESPMPDWLYGFWDATYISSFGIDGKGATRGGMFAPDGDGGDSSGDVEAPSDIFWECGDESTFVGFMRLSMDPKNVPIAKGFVESSEKAHADERFKQGVAEWEACVKGQGYELDPDSAMTILTDDSISDEDKAKANLTEAKCADDLGTTQKLADIEAGYQAEYISRHQGELAEEKRLADDEVRRAKELLASVGLG